MKKSPVTIGAMIAAALLISLGVATPAMADVTVQAPFQTSDQGSFNYSGFAAVSRDGSLAAVSMEYGRGVTVVDVATGAQRDITINGSDLGYPVFSPDNSLLYVADYSNNSVWVIDLSDDSVNRVIGGLTSAWVLQISPDGNTLYVADYSTGQLSKVDLANGDAISTLSTSAGYMTSMCISADGSTLYVPDYVEHLLVINTSTWNGVDASWDTGDYNYPYSCETDNDGNLILSMFGDMSVIKFAPDGSSFTQSDSGAGILTYAAAPSCDAVYLADTQAQGLVPSVNLSTLASQDSLAVTETVGGDGFFGVSADRSADGSVVVIGGEYASDGLAIITSPECMAAPTPDPSLPDTGRNGNVTLIAVSVSGGLLVVGLAVLLIARRREGTTRR